MYRNFLRRGNTVHMTNLANIAIENQKAFIQYLYDKNIDLGYFYSNLLHESIFYIKKINIFQLNNFESIKSLYLSLDYQDDKHFNDILEGKGVRYSSQFTQKVEEKYSLRSSKLLENDIYSDIIGDDWNDRNFGRIFRHYLRFFQSSLFDSENIRPTVHKNYKFLRFDSFEKFPSFKLIDSEIEFGGHHPELENFKGVCFIAKEDTILFSKYFFNEDVNKLKIYKTFQCNGYSLLMEWHKKSKNKNPVSIAELLDLLCQDHNKSTLQKPFHSKLGNHDPIIKYGFNTSNFYFDEESVNFPIFYSKFSSEEDEFYLVKTKHSKDNVAILISERDKLSGKNHYNFEDKKRDYRQYKRRFRELKESLLNFVPKYGIRICFLSIPSSDANVENLPSVMASNLNRGVTDITLSRKSSKEARHISEDRRKSFWEKGMYEEESQGLLIENSYDGWWNDFDVILVIDDVVTTGGSFTVINKFLMDAGVPEEKLVNFAFYKYLREEDFKAYKAGLVRFYEKTGPIDGIIWDFDGTIVDSRNRKLENKIPSGKASSQEWAKFFQEAESIYPILDSLMNVFNYISRRFPYTIVSNSSKSRIKILLSQKSTCQKIFPSKEISNMKSDTYWDLKPINGGKFSRFEANINNVLSDNDKKYKPNPNSINTAIEMIQIYSEGRRIIGIGNTRTDILAYKSAGLEAILVTWYTDFWYGDSYGADWVFHHPDDLLTFIKENEWYLEF